VYTRLIKQIFHHIFFDPTCRLALLASRWNRTVVDASVSEQGVEGEIVLEEVENSGDDLIRVGGRRSAREESERERESEPNLELDLTRTAAEGTRRDGAGVDLLVVGP
jgi:hypothetical protein